MHTAPSVLDGAVFLTEIYLEIFIIFRHFPHLQKKKVV